MEKERGSLELKCKEIIPKDKIPKGMMAVLDETGDTRVEWDPDDKDEVKAAREQFDQLMEIDGMKAYRIAKDGGKGIEITRFVKSASKILLVPQIAGG